MRDEKDEKGWEEKKKNEQKNLLLTVNGGDNPFVTIVVTVIYLERNFEQMSREAFDTIVQAKRPKHHRWA